jgi:hypothetical protein
VCGTRRWRRSFQRTASGAQGRCSDRLEMVVAETGSNPRNQLGKLYDTLILII